MMGGCYQLVLYDIDINLKMLIDFDEVILIGVIKYELCYYYLYLIKWGYWYCDVDFK